MTEVVIRGARTRILRGARAAVTLALLVSAPDPVAAQDADRRGAVRGVVLEADSDRPIPSAWVMLVELPEEEAPAGSAGDDGSGTGDGPGGSTRVDFTDEGGRYGFGEVAPGRYRIDISGVGYRPASVWVDLPRDWELRRSVALEVEPVVLEPVDVVLPARVPRVPADLAPLRGPGVATPEATRAGASPRLYGLDVRVLDPRALPGVGALGEPDVFRALQRLPGVSSRGDFAADIWTRGSPWGMTQVLLDGLPLYDPLHLGGIASGLAADGLESVALLPGVRPPSAAEGAAGTIALSTRPAAPDRSGSVSVSSMAVRGHVEQRALDGRIGMAVTARRSWWDLLRPPSVFTADASEDDVEYRFADVAARLDARLGPVGLLEAGGLWEEDRLVGEIADLVSASRGRWGNRLGWVRLGRTTRGVQAETLIGAVDYRVATRPLPWAAFQGPRGVPSLDHIETRIQHVAWGVRLRGTVDRGRVTWGAGARLLRERLEQFGADAEDRGLPGVREPAELERARGWLEATWDLGSVDLAGGASLHGVPDGTPRPPILPSLRLRWDVLPWLTLEGARGGGVQFVYPLAPAGAALGPSLATGYVWIMAVDDIRPLVSQTSTTAAEVVLPGGLSTQVTAWWRDVDGLSLPGVSVVDSGDLRPLASGVSGGREQGRGFEARLSWRDERGAAGAAYSLGRSRFSAPDGSSWSSPAERRHSLDLHALVRVGDGVTVGADFTAESGWPLMLGPPSSCGETALDVCVEPDEHDEVPTEYAFTSAPRYASLDLEVEWEHTWERLGLGITGSLRNALGRDNAAAYRSGTCDGAELVSSVCEQIRGLARFSSGLTGPTPSIAVTLRF